MLRNEKIQAFVASANPDKAKAFYADVLGLELLEESPYALVFNANGTTLRIQKVDECVQVPYTVLGWEVENIATMVKSLIASGVVFTQFEHLPQDDLGVWETPDGAKVVWFTDPDGNTLSVTQLA